jgi:hypothetical protein
MTIGPEMVTRTAGIRQKGFIELVNQILCLCLILRSINYISV